jgi:hypothetical protein
VATATKEREISTETVDASDHLTLSRWLAETLLRWRLIALVIAFTFAATVLAFLCRQYYRWVTASDFRAQRSGPSSWVGNAARCCIGS